MMTLFGPTPVDLFRSTMEFIGLRGGGTPGSAWLYGFAEYWINSLWQGTLIVILVALALRLIGRANAATRHTIWCATLIAVMGVPLLSSGLAQRTSLPLARVFSAAEASIRADAKPVSVASIVERDASHSALPVPRTRVNDLSQGPERGQRRAAQPFQSPVEADPPSATLPASLSDRKAARSVALPGGPWMFALFALWLGVALLRLLRLANGYRTVRRILSSSRALPRDLEAQLAVGGVGAGAKFAESSLLSVPALVGFVSPVVVFPASVVASLSESELKCIALHELAHARRRDQWTNLVQRLVESLFFFHPAVIWVSKRLTLEREIACDDWVVAATGKPRPYAACLARLIECAQRPVYALPVPGAVLTRQQFLRRVETLLNR
jgi:beta-lactamase regulating signal transducer with metallopeptidase domain